MSQNAEKCKEAGCSSPATVPPGYCKYRMLQYFQQQQPRNELTLFQMPIHRSLKNMGNAKSLVATT